MATLKLIEQELKKRNGINTKALFNNIQISSIIQFPLYNISEKEYFNKIPEFFYDKYSCILPNNPKQRAIGLSYTIPGSPQYIDCDKLMIKKEKGNSNFYTVKKLQEFKQELGITTSSNLRSDLVEAIREFIGCTDKNN